MATEAVSAGGQGEILANPAPSRSDLRLVRKAINGGYNLTPEQRQLVVARAVEILEAAPEVLANKDGHALGVSYRDQLAAAKVLLACDKMDLDVERLAAGVASGVTHNTQVNIDARGGPAEMFRSLIDEVRSLDTSRVTSTVDRHDVPAEHPVKAPAEPAGDNQP